jgi:hypothetical protein
MKQVEGGKDLFDAVHNLLTFRNCHEQRSQHLINLQVALLAHGLNIVKLYYKLY